ncbi:hypothetical protein ACX1NX_01705 [Acinetobacter sp. ANC 5383]
MGFTQIFGWFAKLFTFWKELPKEDQEKVIKMIVKAYETILRKFYKAHEQHQNKDQQQKD